MITISVSMDVAAIKRKLQAQQKAIQAATPRAVTRTGEGARTQAINVISSEYRLTKAFVRERLALRKASRKGPHAYTATLIGNPAGKAKRAMNVIHFAVAKLTRSEVAAWRREAAGRLTRPQIPFQVKRGGGRVHIKGAFVGNDGRTVFRRTGDKRLPIEPVQTIGVPQMFTSTKVQRTVRDWISANFPRIFEAELKYRMAK